jgi:nicotinamide-nucleotide amidase
MNSNRKAETARVEILCVGTELLSGRADGDGPYIAKKLRAAGLVVGKASQVPDDDAEISRALGEALSRSEAAVVCGGLGPTFDDVTREGAARALKRGLQFRPELFREIERKLRRHGAAIPASNRRQAYLIEGATPLPNTHGSAPGQRVIVGRGKGEKTVYLLPGPPREMSLIFDRQVLPDLKRRLARGRHVEGFSLHLSGVAESEAEELLQPIVSQKSPGLDFTMLASDGEVEFHALIEGPNPSKNRALKSHLLRRTKALVGPHIFGAGEDSLENAVGRRLLRRGFTLAVAESCTAGMLASRITRVPGSSRYFLGGYLVYSNDLKRRLLGVKSGTLRGRGAVSAECAAEMARLARRRCRSSLGLSITGIAGPGGGTPGKPVGTVFFGLSGPHDSRTEVFERWFSGDRETVRRRACAFALHQLLRALRQSAEV